MNVEIVIQSVVYYAGFAWKAPNGQEEGAPPIILIQPESAPVEFLAHFRHGNHQIVSRNRIGPFNSIAGVIGYYNLIPIQGVFT